MATPITDENAKVFLQPVVDDIIAQVKGVVDPLRVEVAAMKAAAVQEAPAPTATAPVVAPAPAAPVVPAQVKEPSVGIPEGVDITDPKSIAAHAARLEAEAVNWNDPAEVQKYQEKLKAEATPPIEGTPAAGDGEGNEVNAEKAKLEAKIAELETQKAALEGRSNQSGSGGVVVPARKADKIDTFEAGHAIAALCNVMNGHEAPKSS